MATATATAPAKNDPWSMEASSGGGQGDYVACPAGNYPSTIVALFDIGHQPESYNGQAKDVRKLVIVVELAKKRPDGKPFILAERYTWSLSQKAKFRGLVENLTGTTFKDGDRFDPRMLVGNPVMTQVTNQTNGDRTYHNIGSISQFPEGFDPPKPTRDTLVWSVLTGEPFPSEATDWLPYIYGESIKDLAESSREVRGSQAPAPTAQPTSAVQPAGYAPAADGDEIPF